MKALTVSLLSFTAIALVALGFAGWRAQTSLQAQLTQLSEQIQKIGEAKEQTAVPPANVVKITGSVFHDTPNSPIANHRVFLIRLRSDSPEQTAQMVHRVGFNLRKMDDVQVLFSNSEGKFDSGWIVPGTYYVGTSISDAGSHVPGRHIIQSEPAQLLSPGMTKHVQLNLGLAKSRLVVKLSPELEQLAMKPDHLLRQLLFSMTMREENLRNEQQEVVAFLSPVYAETSGLDPAIVNSIWPKVLIHLPNNQSVRSHRDLVLFDGSLPQCNYGLAFKLDRPNLARGNLRKLQSITLDAGKTTTIVIGVDPEAAKSLARAFETLDAEPDIALQVKFLKDVIRPLFEKALLISTNTQ